MAILHLRQLLCGIGGHDLVMHFEQDRISLECLHCGYQTAGWSLRPEGLGSAPLPIHEPSPLTDAEPGHPRGIVPERLR